MVDCRQVAIIFIVVKNVLITVLRTQRSSRGTLCSNDDKYVRDINVKMFVFDYNFGIS